MEEAEVMLFRMIHVRKAKRRLFATEESPATDENEPKATEMSRVRKSFPEVVKKVTSEERLDEIYKIAYKGTFEPQPDLLFDNVCRVMVDYFDDILTAGLERILYRSSSNSLRLKVVIAFIAGSWEIFESRLTMIIRVLFDIVGIPLIIHNQAIGR